MTLTLLILLVLTLLWGLKHKIAGLTLMHYVTTRYKEEDFDDETMAESRSFVVGQMLKDIAIWKRLK